GGLGGWLWQQYGPETVFLAAAALTAGWLLLVLGMPPLAKLDSRVLPLVVAAEEADRWVSQLLAVEGVLEAVVLPESGIALLKVDPASLDEAALALLTGDAVAQV